MLLLLLLRTSDKHVMVCYSSSSSGILDDDTFDEYAVVIYMAVLRRKVSSYNWLVQIFALWRATQFLWNRVSPFNTHIPPALTKDFEILLHQKNAFSPTALRKIHWWTYIPAENFPNESNSSIYFFLFYLLPAENLSFSITTFRNYFFLAFLLLLRKSGLQSYNLKKLHVFVCIFILHLTWPVNQSQEHFL